MVNVFIHGNMRSGGKDNKFISGAVLRGRAETESDFALVLIKGDPYVTKRPVSKIKGEVYSVDDNLLGLIDRLNKHKRITKRELVKARLENGQETEAWVYFYTEPLNNSVLVESGEYLF
ncbi:MAG: gamma-glutamylcyclotransferase [Nitrospirae bacterium]|nr:gamma-glutamylcyclotransferase [Nitrospirota bacterium]